MRIAINTRFLLKDKLEGLGVYTHEVSSRLVRMMPEHQWFFFFDRPFDPAFIPDHPVKPVVIFPPARHPFLWYWWFEHSIPRQLKKYEIDLFFSPDGYASLSTDVPQLLTIHDVAFEYYPEGIPYLVNKYYRYYTPKFCTQAQYITCVSEKTKEDIIRHYGISADKISVVHNGYSAIFKPMEADDIDQVRSQFSIKKPFFIYLGAIHPRKNVLAILQAFEKLKVEHPALPHQLVLVGRKAWDNDALESFFQKMAYKKDVHWIDHIQRHDIPPLLNAATALVYPSFYEGFGLPVLEAMACGTPSITSADSSMAAFARDSCLTVTPQDSTEISNSMFQLVNQPGLRQSLSEKGLRYSADMTWDKAGEKIAALIENLLLKGKKA